MELIFLGTGAGMPSSRRNVTSMALRFTARKSQFWLIDCGEATQHQIMGTSLKLSKLEKVLITHLHGDHLFGLPGLLTSRSHQGVNSPLTLYGPVGLKAFVDTAMKISGSHLDYKLEIVEIEREYWPEQGEPLFEDDTHCIYCARLDHRIECFGYRIEEKEKPGRLKEKLLAEAGVPAGPLYARLKRGEVIELEDGRILDGKQYVSAPLPGRVVTLLGDTRVSPNSVKLASGADLLVHEATFRSNLDDLARQYHHATTKQAAQTAAEAGVKALIMTHISPRYQDDEASELLSEAREVFPNTFIAEDLWSYPVVQAHQPADTEK